MGQGESVSYVRSDNSMLMNPNQWQWDETRWSPESSDDESGPASLSSTPSSATSPSHQNNNASPSENSDDRFFNNNFAKDSLQPERNQADVTTPSNTKAGEEVTCVTEHPVSDADMWVAISPVSNRPKTLSDSEPSAQQRLESYRVVGILNPMLMVVHTSRPDVTLALKVHRKNCWHRQAPNSVPPRPVPNMVKLIDWIETEDAVFVITELVTKGRLMGYVNKLQHTAVITPRTSQFNSPRKCSQIAETSHERKPIEPCGISGKNITTDCHALNQDESKEDALKADPEVDLLLQQAQQLLASVSKTLEKSAAQQNELKMIGLESKMRKPRSRSVLPRPRIERRFSSDDATGVRPRTAHASLERAYRSRVARVPEALVRDWAASLVVGLETLHVRGIVWKDFYYDNVLCGEGNRPQLTHHHRWSGVEARLNTHALDGLYVAPEVMGVFPVTSAADWWSLGVLLYQLLSGLALVDVHPQGIGSHTILEIPEDLSVESRSLLTGLLQYEATDRLGSGPYGSEEIKCHPFFRGVDWDTAYDDF